VTADALDEDYLTEHARTQQAAAQRGVRCPRCTHEFHGLPCAKFRSNGCRCASSYDEAVTSCRS
jgi:hypothetical protein